MAEADDTMGRHFWSVVDQYRTAKSAEIEPNRSIKVVWLSEVRTMDATVIQTAESDFPKQLAPAGGAAPVGTRVACAIGAALSGANRGGTPPLRQAGSPGRSLAIATTPVIAATRRIHLTRTSANVFAMGSAGLVDAPRDLVFKVWTGVMGRRTHGHGVSRYSYSWSCFSKSRLESLRLTNPTASTNDKLIA
jgi:hypothetical protein